MSQRPTKDLTEIVAAINALLATSNDREKCLNLPYSISMRDLLMIFERIDALTKERDEALEARNKWVCNWSDMRDRHEKLRVALENIAHGTGKTSWADQLLAKDVLAEDGKEWVCSDSQPDESGTNEGG